MHNIIFKTIQGINYEISNTFLVLGLSVFRLRSPLLLGHEVRMLNSGAEGFMVFEPAVVLGRLLEIPLLLGQLTWLITQLQSKE